MTGEFEDVMEVEVKLSRRCCIANPFLLLDIPGYAEISSLDISGCPQLKATDVINIIDGLKNLKKFYYRDCIQFSCYNIQRVADLAPNLELIDGSGAGYVDATIAMGICCKLKKLRNFWIMPDARDLKMWEKLAFDFDARICFGMSVLRMLANNTKCHNFHFHLPEM